MMAAGLSNPARKGVYRSLDPIRNFKIRVHLDEKIVASSAAESAATANIARAPIDGDTDEDLELRPLPGSNITASETYLLSWQEKVFSKRERRLYENEANCSTILQKKYNKEILASRQRAEQTKRLFTYTDADLNASSSKEDEAVSLKSLWWHAAYLNPLTRRKQGPVPQRTDATEKMLIMADVEDLHGQTSRDLDTEDREVILCTVTVNRNGLITVYPDFCKPGDHPCVLTVQLDDGNTVVFEYKILHASNQPDSEDGGESDMKDFPSLTTVLPYSGEPGELDMPRPNTTRMCASVEIVSVEGFVPDCLFTQYFMDLPFGWTLEQGSPTYGTTQTCYAKREDKTRRAYFCHLLSFVLSFESDVTCPNWPQFLVHVLSRDAWGCCRTEGYTAVQIPPHPGCWSRRMGTWRPIDDDPVTELRRFFIGGSLELEDVAYVSTPSTFQGKYLSKLGMRTQSGGEITIRANVTLQSQQNMSGDHAALSGLLGVNVALGNKPLEASVAQVVEAFHRARRRMIAARESVAPPSKTYIAPRPQI